MNRQLPNDCARCLGLTVEDPGDEDNVEWVEGCKNCLRRTSVDGQAGVNYWWFDPPASFAVDCPERIAD